MGNIITEDTITYNSTDSFERNKKEKEYLDYIANHIRNVKLAFAKISETMINFYKESKIISNYVSNEDIIRALSKLSLNINTHDASKFSDSEFDAYRAKYYPTEYEKNSLDEKQKELLDDKYEKAWEHHYKTNAHHPKYWLNSETGVPEDMSLEAIIEMLCDWEAMSMRFGTFTSEWYKNDAKDEKAAMSSNTKAIVEDILGNILV